MGSVSRLPQFLIGTATPAQRQTLGAAAMGAAPKAILSKPPPATRPRAARSHAPTVAVRASGVCWERPGGNRVQVHEKGDLGVFSDSVQFQLLGPGSGAPLTSAIWSSRLFLK